MSTKPMSPEELAKEHGRINGPGASYSYLAGYHSRDTEVEALREVLKEVRWQANEWRRAAESWEKDYDKLKNKYEPMHAIPSQPTTEKGEG